MGPVSTTSTTTDGLPPSTGATTAQAVIDLGAIAHNVKLLREHAGTARLMTVVKADGYGHGAVRVARAALAAGADELGVTSIAEALQIRAAGLDAPLLAWLHAPGADYAAALHADVEVAVSSLGQLGELLAAARSTGRQAITSIKVDTGLNRNGVPAGYTRDLFEALAKAQAEESIRLRGIMSHFAYADQPGHPTVDMQIGRFNEALELARGFGLRYELAHLSNSAATLTRPDARYDMVRPGIAVYGINPLGAAESATSNRGRTSFDLIPAMSLTCAVSSVKPVSAGEGVSYGHVWTAPRDTNAALIGIGYADGWCAHWAIDSRWPSADAATPISAGFAWTSSWLTWVTTMPGCKPVMWQRFSGREQAASRPRRTGRSCSTPSPTKWSPARGAGWCGRTGIPGPLSNKSNAWLAGVAGLGAVVAVAGVGTARSIGRRRFDDPYRGENFDLLQTDRGSIVTTDDGVRSRFVKSVRRTRR